MSKRVLTRNAGRTRHYEAFRFSRLVKRHFRESAVRRPPSSRGNISPRRNLLAKHLLYAPRDFDGISGSGSDGSGEDGVCLIGAALGMGKVVSRDKAVASGFPLPPKAAKALSW